MSHRLNLESIFTNREILVHIIRKVNQLRDHDHETARTHDRQFSNI